MDASVSLNRQDWSLHRKGPIDQARHNEKVKEAIKGNLPAIIGEEALITADGNRIVKIPIRSLELPHFRFGRGRGDRAGQGEGNSKVGDVIGRESRNPGDGQRAGDQPGIDYYEAELTIDELAALAFEDLGLPFLKPKVAREVLGETVRFTDLRRQGILANLDKRRSLLENMRRNARNRRPEIADITRDDLRFKTWEPDVKPESSAVVIAMRDVSGSMGEFEKYISRSFYLWMVRFLRTKYQNVEIAFITHHTEAREVDEDTFFRLGESGGTRVSSAYQLALKLVQERFDPGSWNIYPFHFSDGDNWGDGDNMLCLELVKQLLELASAFGYGEIRQGGRSAASTLMTSYARANDPRFICVTIASKEEVYPALRKFFSTREEILS
ncbi:MAG TPA: sporulation protein YhbH [Chloroflexota bacterium]|nr:sporulation protein YhbH [Chloroflexota bacterium]